MDDSNIISPAIATLCAIEEEGHALFCACWKVHSFIMLACWTLHVFSPWQCRIRPYVLQYDCPLALTMLNFVSADTGMRIWLTL